MVARRVASSSTSVTHLGAWRASAVGTTTPMDLVPPRPLTDHGRAAPSIARPHAAAPARVSGPPCAWARLVLAA